MLSKLMAMTKGQLKSTIQSIDASAVKGRNLRRKFEAIRSKKEGGFTLLELLVVVAILAAIAGTATIMLQDTDRKASAAAHVAMMDELSKGIQTFRVLNQGAYPDNWDSLLQDASGALTATSAPLSILSEDLADQLDQTTLTATELTALNSVGITQVRVLDTDASAADYTCSDTTAGLQAVINSKDNNVTAQNIYRPTSANGCGADASHTLVADDPVMIWNGGLVRVGVSQAEVDAAVGTRLVAFGVGPDSTLFEPSIIGALSNTPVYRHVAPDEYNRFIVLWKVTGNNVNGQAAFQAIVDGAGDTKDEELGEMDNVRAT